MKAKVRKYFLRHVFVLVSHPHHYATAVGCTIFMVIIGHYESAALTAFWVYAMVENVFDKRSKVVEEITFPSAAAKPKRKEKRNETEVPV